MRVCDVCGKPSQTRYLVNLMIQLAQLCPDCYKNAGSPEFKRVPNTFTRGAIEAIGRGQKLEGES